PEDVARQRVEYVSELQEVIADEAAARFVGQTMQVLVDEVLVEDDVVVGTLGRSWREAPDTDGEVRLEDADGRPVEVPAGRTIPVLITASEGVDLIGIPAVPGPSVPVTA
ncbi:MAG: ribosomal protein S12 methylthiotransferase, partial [Glaciecola sp.]